MIDPHARVNAAWSLVESPPISRAEAERAARVLYRRFGKAREYPRQRRDAKLHRVRRVWISSNPSVGTISRGLARLVHDVSHEIHRLRYPDKRPHNPLQALLETEIAHYVICRTDWLRGGLRSNPGPKTNTLSLAETRARASDRREARVRENLKRAEADLARAQARVERWSKKVRYYDRKPGAAETAK